LVAHHSLVYKIIVDLYLIMAVKIGPSENRTNGALHKPKLNFEKTAGSSILDAQKK
jgi:hypothetical protein